MSRQQKLILAYIQNYDDKDKLGYSLDENNFQWMLQPGQSSFHGYNLEKGELADFIKEASEGRHKNSCLIIENIDRFSRATPAKSTFTFLGLVMAGVHIHEAETKTVFTDTLNIEELSSSLTRANRESVRKKVLSDANWKIRFEDAIAGNAVLTKRVPQWMDVKDNKYVLNEKTYLINYIFDRFCEGIGSTSIARELNAKNMLMGDGLWYPGNVNRLLSDIRVKGWVVSSNKDREDIRIYPQIISDVQFDKVQDIKKSKQPILKHKPKPGFNNLLNGISTCSLCGSSMAVVKSRVKGKEYLRYFCANRKTTQECKATSIRYDLVEHIVSEHILNFDWGKFFNKNNQDNALEELRAKLVEDTNYRNEVSQMIDASSRPPIHFLKALANVQKSIDDITSRMASIENTPVIVDASNFDITNDEDRIKYNLMLKKIVSKIDLVRHDTITKITFSYFSSNIEHVILLDSMTGNILSNITKYSQGEDDIYLSPVMNITYNTTTSECNIEGLYFSQDLALMLNFMEMINAQSHLIDCVRLELGKINLFYPPP
ncbi:hypothetical protein AC790_09015 [Pantoea sp. RIT-PI-b]|nr:hypothetical protein AC790_09015 [Pantoea sp. RIT-PI-b]